MLQKLLLQDAEERSRVVQGGSESVPLLGHSHPDAFREGRLFRCNQLSPKTVTPKLHILLHFLALTHSLGYARRAVETVEHYHKIFNRLHVQYA